MVGDDEKYEFIMYEKVRTAKAVLAYEGPAPYGEDNPHHWLPLSQINIEESTTVRDQVTIMVPEWLAKKRGLI